MSKHEMIIPKKWQGRKAEYMALCVNNHEKLLEALQECEKYLDIHAFGDDEDEHAWAELLTRQVEQAIKDCEDE